jgi:hypothetical protein
MKRPTNPNKPKLMARAARSGKAMSEDKTPSTANPLMLRAIRKLPSIERKE